MTRSLWGAMLALFLFTSVAHAECTEAFDVTANKTLYRKGDCAVRRSPASTFKIALALMGFDSGLLKDAHDPVLPYKPEYNASMESHRHDTDPTYWEKESVVWYSQELTKKLGLEKFQHYVDLLNYGNRNLSGKDGLTHAWLSSTLAISPDEQIVFLKNMLTRRYKLSPHAYEMTMNVIPRFDVDNGWTVHGKTGTGTVQNQKRQFGWFVGWAENGDHYIVFARYAADKTIIDTPAGPRNRDEMLSFLPKIVPKD